MRYFENPQAAQRAGRKGGRRKRYWPKARLRELAVKLHEAQRVVRARRQRTAITDATRDLGSQS